MKNFCSDDDEDLQTLRESMMSLLANDDPVGECRNQQHSDDWGSLPSKDKWSEV